MDLRARHSPIMCVSYLWYEASSESRVPSDKLLHLGFQASKVDTSLFFYSKGSVSTFLLLYIDSIIVASSSQDAIDVMLRDLSSQFALKNI